MATVRPQWFCVGKSALDANNHLITTISIIVIKKTATALTTALIISRALSL